MASFRDCGLAFRFSAVDRLYEPPSEAATRGTVVHEALQRLYRLDREDRTPLTAGDALSGVLSATADNPDYTELGLSDERAQAFQLACKKLMDSYFNIEDPRAVEPVGLELMMEVSRNGLRLRGIIDRLELDGSGGLIVSDYKTGRAPSQRYEGPRLSGVHFYSMLCEELLGVRPSAVQLIFLGGTPEIIVSQPTEQSTRGLGKKIDALWEAILRSCDTEDFRPNPGKLCDWCSFRAYCPAFGGKPEHALVEIPRRRDRNDGSDLIEP